MQVLLYPGEVGELVDLNDALAAVHEGERAARQRQIDQRRAADVPLDDGEGAPALVPLPPYERVAKIEGVSIAPRGLDDRRWRELSRAWVGALKEQRSALTDGDEGARDNANEKMIDFYRAFVGEGVGRVVIRGTDVRLDEAGVSMLARMALLPYIVEVVAAAQDLTAGKDMPSGSLAPSISGASIATPAPKNSGGSSAVTAAPSINTAIRSSLPAPRTRPTSARGAISDETPTSPEPSPSQDESKKDPGSILIGL